MRHLHATNRREHQKLMAVFTFWGHNVINPLKSYHFPFGALFYLATIGEADLHMAR